jgi:hypothetical protein
MEGVGFFREKKFIWIFLIIIYYYKDMLYFWSHPFRIEFETEQKLKQNRIWNRTEFETEQNLKQQNRIWNIRTEFETAEHNLKQENRIWNRRTEFETAE